MSSVGILLGQRIRRDWRQLTLWIVGTAGLAYLAYTGVGESFGTEQERSALIATALANPVILLFRGLPSGVGQSSVMVFLILPWLAMLAAFMSTFLAVRHTRGEEEPGRAELIAATPAGRTAPIVATALHGLLANVLLAALTTAAFLATGSDPGGSLLVGAAAGSVGVAFLGIGLFAAQLMRTSRGANSVAVWTLLVTFVMCGIGNALGTPSDDLTRMESSGLTWLSPFGWAENTRAFDEDAWWPLALCLGLGVVLAGVAIALTAARDLGGSFIAERQGRTTAPASLSGPAGLVWRLTRGSLLGWAVGGLLTGILATTLASVVGEIGAQNPAIGQILDQISGGGDLEQATITTFFTMLGILAACAAVQTVCRARQEESHGTAEPVLATGVGRVRWLTGYLALALAGLLAVVAAGAAGSLLGLASRGSDEHLVKTVLVTAAGQVAAASVFLALTALVFVLLPRLTIPIGWMLVVVGMTLGLFGPIFGFPEWVTNLSPIAVAPVVQGDDVDVQGVWWLIAVVGAGVAASLALMRRRELAAGG
ncbi:polyketide antibiotic transporter [Microbacterium sp. CFH 31415]|uniref:ABC transporter permease n=1 Tax=Microbacterium sp. CFH 31415 TaxID=2921732 RepID=UPI001F12CED5|nr:polyketide antibiotic transporter [Microbacterium sp. CFH 31415]MCH6231659.1 polyketide antibiotic transporter [Microbacterium sp. CFH 31415]